MKNKMRKKVMSIAFLVIILIAPRKVYSQENLRLQPVDEKIVNETREIYQAGTYFIRLDGPSELKEDYSKLVRIHVTFPKTVLNYEKAEGIDAHDVVFLPDHINKLTQSEIVEAANAHAWNMNTGEDIKDISVTVLDPKKNSGTVATIEFSTSNNTTVQINAYEQSKIPLHMNELYMDQKSVLVDSIRQLASIVLVFMIIPVIIFIFIFRKVQKESRKIQKLLNS